MQAGHPRIKPTTMTSCTTWMHKDPANNGMNSLNYLVGAAGIGPIDYCRFVGESFLGLYPIQLKLMAGEE